LVAHINLLDKNIAPANFKYLLVIWWWKARFKHAKRDKLS